MNSKKVISLSVIAIATISTTATSAVNLQKILSAYCVPKTGNECSGSFRATFTGTSETTDATSKNYCQCGACNMYYDVTERKCKECPVGTYVNNKVSTSCIQPTCGVGHYSEVEVGVNDCPKGYYKEVFSSCK